MPAAKGSVPWNAGTSNGWTDKRVTTGAHSRSLLKGYRHDFEVSE